MGTKRNNKPKIIVILGPTASGKSEFAVRLAKKFNSEIISADSRQVYKGMDIGSGKITEKEKKGVPHYLLDVASPKRKFTVARYQELAKKEINKIIKKKKIPIVAGGTAFYIKALIEGMVIPQVAPDWKLRRALEKKEADELYSLLKKLDPKRAKNIEKKNKRRLVRAIEIVKKTKKPVPSFKQSPKYNPLFLGIKIEEKELHKRIEKRLFQRLRQGMIAEVKKIRESGVSWRRLEELGLEYEWVAKYLQEKISYEEMTENLLLDIKKFSKKQKNWWKYDKRINWIEDCKEAEKLVKNFLLYA